MRPPGVKPRRCAVYTRVSTEHGLEQEFNSLAAQREACEAYITSQKHEGWALRPSRQRHEAVNSPQGHMKPRTRRRI